MYLWHTNAPIMTDSKDGQDHKKYLDTSKRSCHKNDHVQYGSFNTCIHFLEVMTNIIFSNWSNFKVKMLSTNRKILS